VGNDLVSRILTGNEFQTLGAENQKARDPNVNLWRGTKSWWELDDRRYLLGSWCCRRSERYGGRAVYKALKVMVASLNPSFNRKPVELLEKFFVGGTHLAYLSKYQRTFAAFDWTKFNAVQCSQNRYTNYGSRRHAGWLNINHPSLVLPFGHSGARGCSNSMQ